MNYQYASLETLPSKVADQLAGDIDRNEFAPGDRLPGDRMLAERYNVGRSSMIAALQILQKKGYIERIPMRGTFVCKDVRTVTKELQIFFPMAQVEQDSCKALTSMITLSEVMQGLIADCKNNNYSVTFRLFQKTQDQLVLSRQLDFIKNHFHAVVFLGYQPTLLQELVFQYGIPAVNIHPMPFWGENFLPFVGYDQETALQDFAQYIANQNLKSLGIFSTACQHREDQRDLDLRILYFRKALEKLNIRMTEYLMPSDNMLFEEKSLRKLESILLESENLPDVLCGVSYQMVLHLQNIIAKHQISRKIIALTGNREFSGLYPQVPYLRVPFFEMGRQASKILVEHIREGKKIENQFIQPKIWTVV